MLENGNLPPASQVDALLGQHTQLHAALAQSQVLLGQVDSAMKALGNYRYSVDGDLQGIGRRLDQLLWQRLMEVCREHIYVEPMIGDWHHLTASNTPFGREEVDRALANLDQHRHRMLVAGIVMAADKLFDAARLVEQTRVQGLFTYNPPWGANAYRNKVDPRSLRMMGRGLGGGGYFTINEHKMQHLDALYRMMCLAEGHALPAADALPSNWLCRPDYGAAPWQAYFTVDRYKNGNGRITIQRMDLARQLNTCLDEWEQDSAVAANAPAALIGGSAAPLNETVCGP